MADSGGGCYRCCCSFFFTLGLTALFVWLSLRKSNPKCSIQGFYLPSLNQTNDSNLTITFRLENPNKDKGIKYDDLNVTVYDFPNRSHVLGNVSVPKFYQGHKRKATKNGTGSANVSVARRSIFPNGTSVFRVDMETAVRFKILFWYTKRNRIKVGADVTVNANNGTNVYQRKGYKLRSTAPKLGGFSNMMGGLVNFLVFTLLTLW